MAVSGTAKRKVCAGHYTKMAIGCWIECDTVSVFSVLTEICLRGAHNEIHANQHAEAGKGHIVQTTKGTL